MPYKNDEEIIKAYKEWIGNQPNKRTGELRNPAGYTHNLRRIKKYFNISLINLTLDEYKRILNAISNWPIDGSIRIDPYKTKGNVFVIDKSDKKSDFKTNWKDFGTFMGFNQPTNTITSQVSSVTQNDIYRNLIVYGIPGCGKSFYLNTTILGYDCVNEQFNGDFDPDNIIRTTFYPDYSNSDFVGQLRPAKDANGLNYKVFGGPFTKALFKAFECINKNDGDPEKVALVVEEINRGNAAAIFGDIFQLLDRNDRGESEYRITNPTIQQYFKENGINISQVYLPSNLYIFATMNTSDQNVFKLDTAFKRRWEFKRMTNGSDKSKNDIKVPNLDVDWENFIKEINDKISNNEELSGDRQIGKWFIKKPISAEQFANKVLEYLYNDVYKYADKSEIFNVEKYKNFDDIYDAFCRGEKDIFSQDLAKKFIATNAVNAQSNSTLASNSSAPNTTDDGTSPAVISSEPEEAE